MSVAGALPKRSRIIEPLASRARRGLARPRFLACDIDGTILDSRGRLHPVIGDAIAAIAASGVHVVLATGRSPWRGVADLAARLGLRGPQITMQGALLSEPSSGHIYRARPMSPTLYRAALWFADELGLDVVVAMIDGHRVERLPADGALFATPAVQGRDFRYVFGLERLANDRPMRVFIPTAPERHLDVRRAALDRFDGHVRRLERPDWDRDPGRGHEQG